MTELKKKKKINECFRKRLNYNYFPSITKISLLQNIEKETLKKNFYRSDAVSLIQPLDGEDGRQTICKNQQTIRQKAH